MLILGENIRHYRELRHYSQEYMAACLEINQSTYSKLENDSTALTIKRLMQITEILDVDLNQLLNVDHSATTMPDRNKNGQGKAEYSYQQPPEQILDQYEKRIARMQEEIHFLRKLLINK